MSATAGYRSVFKPGLFVGQRFGVTGGGSGIGRCVAHERPEAGQSRPPPAGVKQSGKATFA